MHKYIFECKKIEKHFYRGKEKLSVLDNINFRLVQGTSTAVIGPSGSGKTTFLHILAGLDSPSSGEVLFKSKNLKEITENKRAEFRNKEIGFVYQFHHLLPELTSLENVSLPIMISGKEKEEAFIKSRSLLNKVGLSERINHTPSELSGGERQRVAIARALSNTPSCLIMDEPTGDLDSFNAMAVTDVVLNLARDFNLSIILATHDASLSKELDNTFNL